MVRGRSREDIRAHFVVHLAPQGDWFGWESGENGSDRESQAAAVRRLPDDTIIMTNRVPGAHDWSGSVLCSSDLSATSPGPSLVSQELNGKCVSCVLIARLVKQLTRLLRSFNARPRTWFGFLSQGIRLFFLSGYFSHKFSFPAGKPGSRTGIRRKWRISLRNSLPSDQISSDNTFCSRTLSLLRSVVCGLGDHMDATQSENSDEKLETWNNLLQQQSDLFRTTIERNKYLEEKNEELERQVDVWAKAHKTELSLKREAERRTLELERKNRALTEDNSLVLCLVDGDGNIFSPELISAGHTGGAQAATLLNRGIMEHLKTLAGTPTKSPQIWLTIYCNLNGLRDTFLNNHHCTVEQYDAFIEGFNKASPLFSIVDVGSSKEAADTKLKESLRVFTRFPQILKVYFGGLHDNGYTTTLSHLQTEGLLDKLIFLRGYNQIAFQLRDYEIPECTIPGVFMTQKMPVKPNFRRFAAGFSQAHSSPSFQPQSNSTLPQFQHAPSFTPPQSSPPFSPQMRITSPFQLMSEPASPAYAPQNIPPPSPAPYLDPTVPLHKQKPPPCNFYYLSGCRDGHRCRFGHHYILTPEQLADFRKNAKKYPCPVQLKGQYCEFGEDCCMGHLCPRGLNCTFLRQGKCKYNRPEMHIANPNSKAHGKYRAQKQSADGISEMTLSDSGFSQ